MIDIKNSLEQLMDVMKTQQINNEEMAYLNLLKDIIKQPLRDNRTAVKTRSLFSQNLMFSLTDESEDKMLLPMITTKKMPFNIIYEELLWFLRAEENTSYLKERNIKIWDLNTSKSFLDKAGLDYPEGSTGPIYGTQWRNFNNAGIDQIKYVINEIKTNPFSRRLVVSAWNPLQLDKMCLPPCHLMQIYRVDPDEYGYPKYLSCNITMRSGDMFLGVPFNITSYSLLTHMIAYLCGLKAKKIAFNIVDAHVYETHISAVCQQVSRTPLSFPTIKIEEEPGHSIKTIDDFRINNIIVENYKNCGPIKCDMVA